jgi:hypothetical protein
MFRGEILIGIDLEGEEPGDDSKCILDDSVRGGSCVYIQSTHLRALSAVKYLLRFSYFFRQLVCRGN